MQRLIPTSEQLVKLAQQGVAELSKEERREWYSSPITQALFTLLEASRMEAYETIEQGATGDTLMQHMAQAQFASGLVDSLYYTLVEDDLEDAIDIN